MFVLHGVGGMSQSTRLMFSLVQRGLRLYCLKDVSRNVIHVTCAVTGHVLFIIVCDYRLSQKD